MPDTKVSALTDGTTANSTDRIPVARDAGGGTFNNRYVTPGYIGTTLLGSDTALTGSTVTTSSPVLNLTQTWNDGAVTFTGLRFNAAGSSDANSAAGSLLLDLQVGGASRFRVGKNGAIYNATMDNFLSVGATNITLKTNTQPIVFTTATGYTPFAVGYVYVQLGGSVGLGWTSTAYGATGTADLTLTRAAAATLQLGAADAAAPVAQTFKVQGVVAGTSNTAGANFTIQGSQGTGTGAGGSIIFQVAPAGSSGTAQNAYSTALTIASNSNVTFGGDLYSSGANFNIYTTGSGYFWSRATISTLSGIISASSAANTVQMSNNVGFGWVSNTSPFSGTPDLVLYRDAASTLALRNGNSTGAAQRFNVYNTYTSSTNYETFKIDWITTANTCRIGTEKGSGGGTARALEFQTDGTTRLTLGTNGQATFAINVPDPVSILSSVSGFGGFTTQNTSSGGSCGITATNDTTSLLLARVYGTGVSFVLWGAALANYAAVLTQGATSNGLLVGTTTAKPIIFGTDTSEKMRITSDGLVTFQGTTSSFPALKRSTTTLQVRLADDSALTDIEALNLTNGRTIQKFTPLDNQPPASNFATLDTRNSIAVLDFDDTTAESAVFVGVISAGAILTSGISVRIHWMATSATSGDCRWSVAFEDMNTDLDTDSFDTATAGNSAANGTSGVPSTLTLTCTTIDSLVAGDFFRIKVTRDAANGGDTMTGDAELIAVEIRQVA